MLLLHVKKGSKAITTPYNTGGVIGIHKMETKRESDNEKDRASPSAWDGTQELGL